MLIILHCNNSILNYNNKGCNIGYKACCILCFFSNIRFAIFVVVLRSEAFRRG